MNDWPPNLGDEVKVRGNVGHVMSIVPARFGFENYNTYVVRIHTYKRVMDRPYEPWSNKVVYYHDENSYEDVEVRLEDMEKLQGRYVTKIVDDE